MTIHYDRKSAQWFQTGLDPPVTIGGMKKVLPIRSDVKAAALSFDLRLQNGRAGPLIGIMTATRANGTITGNSSLFIELQKKIVEMQGFSFIFTADGVKGNQVTGYAYLQDKRLWKKMKFPFPDLVYNRIPYRKSEKEEMSRAVFETLKEQRIPFFNPGFLDKYSLHRLFQNHSVLRNYLPETELITEGSTLAAFLQKHSSVYLKPAQSAKGKGIFRLRQIETTEVLLESLTNRETYPSFHEFWKVYKERLTTKIYLVQEDIHSAQYQGKRYDFRILAHADQEDFLVTGVGIRQSDKQELTTHLPNGGKLLPYALFQTAEHDQFIKQIVGHVGRTLAKELGYFGEFSIDAGISQSGNYFLYEVNSKPMRFDEKEIEDQKINRLCQLFFQLTEFD